MKEPKKYTRYIRQKNKINNQNTSWEFDFDTYETLGEVYYETPNQEKIKVGKGFAPHGGIILKNIYNSGFRMAYDIGVVGIYAFPGLLAQQNGFNKPKFLILGPPDFIQVDNDTFMPLDPTKSYDPITKPNKMDSIGFNMVTYNGDREKELKVTYRSTNKLFGSGSGYLFVTQKFIMTKYSDKPAHEPTGGLKAARFFPITQLIYNIPPENGHKIEDYVESFRVDYRLYISLDTYAIAKTEVKPSIYGYKETLAYDRKKIKDKINNAAGLFKDEDSQSLSDIHGGIANMVFSASEKPLISEIVTEGLNPYNIKTHKYKWDNIHWWGFGKDGVLGSTPGSFHAVHIHWRWAKELQDKNSHSLADLAGDPQFAGKGNNGALVDPTIANQILRIAVVKNENIPNDYHIQKSEVFNDFFINLTNRKDNKPLEFKNGEDMILYYSSEIKLKDCKKNAQKGLICSVFIHGLFFAHEIEPASLLKAAKAGTTNKFNKNLDKLNNKKWERYPTK